MIASLPKWFWVVIALVICLAAFAVVNNIRAQAAGDSMREYNDCINRQIEAGSPLQSRYAGCL